MVPTRSAPSADARRRQPARSDRAGWFGRLALAPLLVAALLATTACDGPAGTSAGTSADTEAVDVGGVPGADAPAPPCPLTAAQMSDLAGLPLRDEGRCAFGDGRGVAGVTVTTASRTAGEATYAYQREQAGQRYDRVVDLGKLSYLAVKDIAGEAVVVGDGGAYTVVMSSFGIDADEYERRLRRLLDAIRA
ncbi:hypothetical protein ACWENR_19605 [Micromonospora sp. NPDC004336]